MIISDCNILEYRILRKLLAVYKVKTRIRYALQNLFTLSVFPSPLPQMIVFSFISDDIMACFSFLTPLFIIGADLQVRHYYYRLVRRMNKLLGPGLCLDAKNSKDTNAAMLRW